MSESQQKTPSLPKLVVMYWGILAKPARLRILGLLGLMLLFAMLELFVLISVQAYLKFVTSGSLPNSRIIPQFVADFDTRAQLNTMSILLATLLVIKIIAGVGTNFLLARTVSRQYVQFSTRLFKAYQYAPFIWFGTRNTADLQRNLSQDTAQVCQRLLLPFLQLVLNGIMSGSVLLFILISLPPVLLISISAIMVVLVLIGGQTQKLLVQTGMRARIASGDVLRATYEGMNAMTEARVLGVNHAFVKRFRMFVGNQGWAIRRRIFLSQALPLVLEGLILIAFVGIVTFMVVTSESLEETFAIAAVLALAIFRLRQVLTKVLTAYNRIGAASPSLPPLVADLKYLEPLAGDVARWSGPPEKRFSTLTFEDVYFQFPDQDGHAVKGISTELKQGEHIAVMGATGAGKSTFLLILLGLVQPTRGEVKVDGIRMSDALADWNAQIGYVPQNVFFIDDTIVANVAFGAPDDAVDPERVRFALQQAQLLDHVDALPQGINTVIGEHGSALSGGQRQRLGLARALYHSPSVIVLDEATSALDRGTQQKVMEALGRLPENPTIISVTHHLEPLAYADRLLVFEKGHLAADGPVAEVRQTAVFERVTRSGGTGEAGQ